MTVGRWRDDYLAPGHAFAHIIVSIAFEVHIEPTRIPHAEALAGCAFQMQRDRLFIHTVITMDTRNFAREPCTDRTVHIFYRVIKLPAATAFDCRQAVSHHFFGEFALIVGFVASLGTKLRKIGIQSTIAQNRLQVEVFLARGFTLDCFQQVGSADYVLKLANAERCQYFAYFAGNETEVIFNFFCIAGVMQFAQQSILCRDAGSAIVEVANAQIFAAHCYHRAGAKAEALGTKNCCLDDIEAGFQAAVGLNSHFFAQFVGAQYLMGFGETQFPGRAGIFNRGQRAGTGATIVSGNRN